MRARALLQAAVEANPCLLGVRRLDASVLLLAVGPLGADRITPIENDDRRDLTAAIDDLALRECWGN